MYSINITVIIIEHNFDVDSAYILTVHFSSHVLGRANIQSVNYVCKITF